MRAASAWPVLVGFGPPSELAITELSRRGVKVISRAQLIDPTKEQHPRGVVWSHPAFANRHVAADWRYTELPREPATVQPARV